MVPGFVGTAVKVTGVPAQMLLPEPVMETLAESPGFTVTIKSTGVPEQLPTLGVTVYLTDPGVGRLSIRIWLITSPESALNPVSVPDVSVAVQWKFAPVGIEVNGMFVDWPEQMVSERELFVTDGTGVVNNCTVSLPMHPFALVTVTV